MNRHFDRTPIGNHGNNQILQQLSPEDLML